VGGLLKIGLGAVPRGLYLRWLLELAQVRRPLRNLSLAEVMVLRSAAVATAVREGKVLVWVVGRYKESE
jgi:hypothetical protein